MTVSPWNSQTAQFAYHYQWVTRAFERLVSASDLRNFKLHNYSLQLYSRRLKTKFDSTARKDLSYSASERVPIDRGEP